MDTRYGYDDAGLLVRVAWDTSGHGGTDIAEIWERGEDGSVITHLWQVYEESGSPVTVWRDDYTYEDGLLLHSETDGDGDGDIDATRSCAYELGRVVRCDSYTGKELQAVVTWAYPEPAPSPDHVETYTDPEGNVAYTTTRTHNDDGQVVVEEQVRGDARSRTTNTWEEGRLVLIEELGDAFYGFWQYSYETHGLLAYRRYDGDNDRDGHIEQANLDMWEWTCD